ncbi:hypothetical protein Tco_0657421 [Tanacetum coccineum]|uniref:Integrase, catalytic region, zinc finger, CCHC-type, peptidase aspartic, catalytic n=1 Tax=Tanacetum coccineum TaxID=301880 RepID=A0ABQ4XCV9_9ASTR
MHTQKSNVPVPPSTGVNSCTVASGSQPRSILKKHRIPPAKSDSLEKVEDHSRTIRSSCKTTNRVDSSISSKRTIRKDHFGAIMGYGDYVIGDSVISRVYYVEGLGHNLFSVGQFCDSDLEVAFRKHSCYVRDTDGVELIKGPWPSNLYTISVEDMMKSSPICLLSKASKNKSWNFSSKDCAKNSTAERRGRKKEPYTCRGCKDNVNFSKHAVSLAEAVANCLVTHKTFPLSHTHDKTPYELVHNKKPDLTFFRVFGALCYPTNDSENLGKLQPTADIGIFVVRTRNLSLWTPGPISSGLVPNPAPAIPFAPPTNKDLEMLFQPMFDEYFNPPGISQNPIPVIPTAASSTGEINIPESSQSTQHHEPVGNRLTHNQVITSLGNHSRTVSTKKTACHGCFVGFYNSVLSTDEPKNIHLPLLKTAWIYKLKLDEYGEFVEKKARLVAKGFRQGKV